MKFAWACSVALVGAALIGTMYAFVRCAVPESGLFRDGVLYLALLQGPYAVCALGCRLFVLRFVRIVAVLVCLAGLAMTCGVAVQMIEILRSGQKPAILGSLFLATALLMVQYMGAVGSFVAGLAHPAGGHEVKGERIHH